VGWKNWPSWLKGGLIGGIILGGIMLIRLVLSLIILIWSCKGGHCEVPIDPIFILVGSTLSTIIYFCIGGLIGVLIGFIIGKIKSSKKKKR